MPNVLTEVAIQGILIERQPYPYPSKCFGNWGETNYTEYIEEQWTYTLQQCQRVRISWKCKKYASIYMHTGHSNSGHSLWEKIKQYEMKNEKNYDGFHVQKL